MESWVVGFDGDQDVERHSGVDTSAGAGPPIRVRVISDYICPWCYIGLVRVERLRREFAIEFDVCAYELRPGLPPEGMRREEAYGGRSYPPQYIENLILLARQSGIDMKRPSHVPNTQKAHEATEFARDRGRLARFHHAVFRAYWEDEQDIGSVDVLCQLAAGCGLPPKELRRALSEGDYTARVRQQMEWSREAAAQGVPTVIFNDRFAVIGAQDYAVFRDVAWRIANGRLQTK